MKQNNTYYRITSEITNQKSFALIIYYENGK